MLFPGLEVAVRDRLKGDDSGSIFRKVDLEMSVEYMGYMQLNIGMWLLGENLLLYT